MNIDYELKYGLHDSPEEGMCAMEWVAYLAGEPHTDSPKCVDLILRDFAISLNDAWDHEQRQKLRPYLTRCIGTANDGRTEKRGWLATDWLIREFTPAFLDLRPELQHYAEKLRSLSPVLAGEALDEAMLLLKGAQKDAVAAKNAAGDAAGVTAWATAGVAAWDAVGVAAGDAIWAAVGVAAWDAAETAARVTAIAWATEATVRAAARATATAWATAAVADAAGDSAGAIAVAARDAARAALEPTVTRLQASALDLFDRMIGQGEIVELPPEKATEYERLLEAAVAS